MDQWKIIDKDKYPLYITWETIVITITVFSFAELSCAKEMEDE